LPNSVTSPETRPLQYAAGRRPAPQENCRPLKRTQKHGCSAISFDTLPFARWNLDFPPPPHSLMEVIADAKLPGVEPDIQAAEIQVKRHSDAAPPTLSTKKCLDFADDCSRSPMRLAALIKGLPLDAVERGFDVPCAEECSAMHSGDGGCWVGVTPRVGREALAEILKARRGSGKTHEGPSCDDKTTDKRLTIGFENEALSSPKTGRPDPITRRSDH
jgi:hypothetical protein